MLQKTIQAIPLASALSGLALSTVVSAQAQTPKQIVPKAPPAYGVPAHGAVIPPAPARHVNPVMVRPHSPEGATREAARVGQVRVNPVVRNAAPGGVIVIAGSLDGRFPRLHAALNALIAANQTMQGGGSNAAATADVQKALHELSQSASNPLFQGHRQGAIDRSIRAVHLLEKGATFEEPDALTRDAIDDLRFCVAVP